MPQAKRKRNIWLKTNDVVAHTGDYGIHKLYGGVDYSVRNNEFVPSIRYSFDYNNYRDRSRAVNTALEIRRRHS